MTAQLRKSTSQSGLLNETSLFTRGILLVREDHTTLPNTNSTSVMPLNVANQGSVGLPPEYATASD